MHFSIPDTLEVRDDNSSSYLAYNIHVNGAFHCTVRYRQLHNFHDQLKREYGPSSLPHFPPKKLLPLTPTQAEERRAHLEKYIQTVSQDGRICTSDIFNGFLLSAQQESQNAQDEVVSFTVYLMNWQKVTIKIRSTTPTNLVLEEVVSAIEMPLHFLSYFCLYLVKKEDNTFLLERRMQDFEAPYLSLQAAGPSCFAVIRKSYWDSSFDDDLLDDRVALNLLYVQAVSDVEQGWTVTNKETQRQLATLQAKGSKREYLQLARTLKCYGYIQFQPCICDFPQPNTSIIISAGGREVNFRIQVASDQVREVSFRVTRIRCWRITTLSDKALQANCTTSASGSSQRLELSFEYLMNKDKLQWVTVVSDQAILMSVCLQGMVEELLMKKNGTQFSKPNDRAARRGSWSYMKRDGSSHQIAVSRSVSTDGIVAHLERNEPRSSKTKDSTSIKSIADKISSMSIKPSARTGVGGASPRSLMENDAFEGIGDDDL